LILISSYFLGSTEETPMVQTNPEDEGSSNYVGRMATIPEYANLFEIGRQHAKPVSFNFYRIKLSDKFFWERERVAYIEITIKSNHIAVQCLHHTSTSQ